MHGRLPGSGAWGPMCVVGLVYAFGVNGNNLLEYLAFFVP